MSGGGGGGQATTIPVNPTTGAPVSVAGGQTGVAQLGAQPNFYYQHAPASNPGINTGLPVAGWAEGGTPTTGGWASAPIDSYLRNLQGFNIDKGGATATPNQQVQLQKQQLVVPPTQIPTVTSSTGGGSRAGNDGVPVIGGGSSSDPSKIPTSVPGNEGAWLNVGVPGQEWSRKNVQRDEHGFTTEEVLEAREKLDAGEILEGFTAPPPVSAPGTSKEAAHANVEQAFNNYGDVLSTVPTDGSATKEQRVAAAAANPGFNPEVANTYAEKAIPVGSLPGTAGLVGLTKEAENIQTKDAERVLSQDIAADRDNRGAKQNALGAATMLSAGVTGLDGKFNQSGDNQGLPDDYLVVGSSDGSSEVWGPDGKTYSSVEEAKADVPNAAKEKAVADLTAAAKSGKLSASQASQAAFKAGVSAADRAKITAQAQASAGPSRREQNEINARNAAKKAAEAQAAADRQAHLDTLSAPEQHHFKAQEAIESGDSGDLKTTIYDLQRSGVLGPQGSLRKKSDSQLKAILAQVQAAPPPVQAPPPPQPVAQAAPAPVAPAAPAQTTAQRAAAMQAQAAATAAKAAQYQAPQPVAQVTPVPAPPPPAPTPAPPPAPSVSSQAAANAIASGDSGDMKTAIYELQRAGVIPKSGSLRKKSKAQLTAILAAAK